jgi:hypothetical protein
VTPADALLRIADRRRKLGLHGLWCVAAALALPAASAGAQVRGVVRDSSGTGLPDARIEWWGADRRLGVSATDARGTFSAIAGDSVVGLVVRRLGYRPATVPRSNWGDSLVVVLASISLPLPEVIVTGGADACVAGRVSEASAERAWTRLAASYRLRSVGDGLAWEGSVDSTEVPATRIGDFEGLRPDTAGRLVGAAQFAADDARLANGEYARAYAVPSGVTGAETRRWRYSALDTYLADHFLWPSFLANHTLSTRADPTGFSEIRFCPRRARRGLRGRFLVARDGTLRLIEYAFDTSAPDLSAGGQLVLAPAEDSRDGLRAFHPAESVLWYRDPVSRTLFIQRRIAFVRYEYRSCLMRRC